MLDKFDNSFEAAILSIERLKQQNDVLARKVDDGEPNSLIPQYHSLEISQLISQLSKHYLNPANFKKLQRLKAEYNRQLQRRKKIMADISVAVKEIQYDEAPNQFSQELTQHLEHQTHQQRNNAIQSISTQIAEINNVMIDTMTMINHQGQNLYLISEHVHDAQNNCIHSTKELEKANERHSRSKKYIIGVTILATIVVVLVLCMILLF